MQASPGKARKLKRGTKRWLAGRNFFVRAVDIGVFSDVARWLEVAAKCLMGKISTGAGTVEVALTVL